MSRQKTNVTDIKLLNLLIFLRSLPPLSLLTGDEERFLFAIYAEWHGKGQFSVSDIYDSMKQKSASSAYRHLMSLQKKGFVHIAIDNADKRRRRVTFTKTAERFFSALQ